MQRSTAIFLVLALSLGTSAWIVAQDTGELRRPLDLPSGGVGGDEDEEDAPEIITFYGSDYEGDGFFWCFDRSGSMAWGGVINTLKQELTQAVTQLSAQAEFSMVRFNSSFEVWSPLPKRATFPNKVNALGWVNATVANGGTSIAPATIAALGVCFQCTGQVKRVILVGDGVPSWCPSPPSDEQNQATLALEEITAANYRGVPIDTVLISNSQAGIQLFQDIAAQNNGTFTNPNRQ